MKAKMTDRKDLMADKKRIVIKIGSSSLQHKETGDLDYTKLDVLVRELCNLRNMGKDVVLVTSGAIAVGEKAILPNREEDNPIAVKQACAAVGQARLMMIYQKIFAEYNQVAAQILMTKNTIVDNLNRYNARNTFAELFKLGVIPIVNENDTIATYEIEIGDNDTLSAIVASLVEADALLLLSDIDGLYSDDPRTNPDVKYIEVVEELTDELMNMGKVTSTCSKCNQTKTETIPATGHNWVVDRTVQTTYDEEGNLLQQGYTIYSCSVCGEQYKDSEGTGPPGTPGGSGGDGEKSIWEKIGEFFGTIGGGFLEIIGAVAGKLLDALTKLAEMLLGKIKTVVETVLTIFDEVPALFGGFLDFLAAIFPFLPPEITSILTFGVIAITFIGILKAVRR